MVLALASHPWAYPMLEVVHIVGAGLLVGNLLLLELRVWGWARDLPVGPLARLSLTLVALGFLLAAASGLLMFATAPAELLANRAFTTKMLLLMLAAGNAAVFHARGSLQRMDATARGLMLISTLIWILVITCGRWIGYW
jgi:hypothetical protein